MEKYIKTNSKLHIYADLTSTILFVSGVSAVFLLKDDPTLYKSGLLAMSMSVGYNWGKWVQRSRLKKESYIGESDLEKRTHKYFRK